MHGTRQRVGTLTMMCCLGAFSALTQVTFLREMLVVFYGNELTIGSILGSWLVCIGAGALAARLIVPRLSSARTVQFVLTVLLLVLGGILLKQASWIRAIRPALGVGAGEYAPLGAIIVCAVGVSAPTCFSIGFCFPCACRLMLDAGRDTGGDLAARGVGAVSQVYAVEALGSMVGGAALTFVLLPCLSPLRIILLAQVVAALGAAAVAPYRPLKVALATLGGVVTVLALQYGATMQQVEAKLVEVRWRGFGVLQESAAQGAAAPCLVASADSVYQNLAVIERAGQYELYGNGEIMWEFPDPLEDEHRIHAIMAQKPDADRILLLGGNPLGDIPELLKYPVERLVYVEPDAGIGRILRQIEVERYDALLQDERVESVSQDGIRYVRAKGDMFDVIIINAPTPSTTAANRYYTREFFRSVRERLAPRGFATFTVQSSARLMDTAADYLASVYRTVKGVFPSVLITAGEENRFFVGDSDAGTTLDRMVLLERSAAAGPQTQYYRPEYFFATDAYDPEKIAFTVRRLEERDTELNTVSRPVSTFHNLRLWLRYSGSDARGLSWVRGLGWQRVVAFLMACGALLCSIGWVVSRRDGAAWPRAMLTGVIATTGFCGMAYELLLIFVFQGLYGYVYTCMGIIVAAFMAGLVIGARSGRALAKTMRLASRSLVVVELALALFPLLILGLLTAAGRASGGALERILEVGIYLALAGAGWMVGAEFPLANRLFCDVGGSAPAAASLTDAADHLGAAVGCVLTGVLLVPVMGIAPTCFILIGLKILSLLMLVSGRMAVGSNSHTSE